MWVELKIRAASRRFKILIAILASVMATSSIAAESKNNMHGIYVLPTGGAGLDNPAFVSEFITGYSIRVPWKALEPRKGQFDWKAVDNIIALARKNGKFVTLRILAGHDSPRWIFDAPDIPKINIISRNPNKEKYFNKPVTLPKLWDSKYLNEYYRFLDALSKRYSDEPLLYWVAVSGPVTSPACPMLPKDRETVDALVKAGYTKEIWLKVWEEAIDRTSQAFPNNAISVCLDVPPFYEEMAGQLAKYAVGKYGRRVCLQSNGLSAKVETASKRNPRYEKYLDIFRQYSDKATIGFQMAWAAAWKDRGRDRLGPLDRAIEAGFRLGASYIEIYQDDIADPANADMLSDAARRFRVSIR